MRFAVLAAALVFAVPAVAAEPAANTPKEKPKKICKLVESNTGSHLGGSGRKCLTAEGWAKLEKRDRPGDMAVEKKEAED